MSAVADRIALLEARLSARDGRPGFKNNVAHLRAELLRLKALPHG